MTVFKRDKNPKFRYIYGPVSSWRLGSSLGIDVLSAKEKACSFDCLYCQIGRTAVKTKKRKIYAPTKDVIKEISNLPPDLKIDYITFSGTGEPTLASNLGELIKKIKGLRREKIAVITNSSLMNNKAVREELALADFVIAKLDAPNEEMFEKIIHPLSKSLHEA